MMSREVKIGLIIGEVLVIGAAVMFFQRGDEAKEQFRQLLLLLLLPLLLLLLLPFLNLYILSMSFQIYQTHTLQQVCQKVHAPSYED